jgi:alpha-glucosidase (family GH31 glycosyl hydrolase)
MSQPSRRTALKALGASAAGLAIAPSFVFGQQGDLIVAGKPVEIAIWPLPPHSVRITVLPITDGRAAAIPNDGALPTGMYGSAPAGRRTASAVTPVTAGDLVVKFTADPPTLHIETKTGVPVQRLQLDRAAATARFQLPKGPLLGFGEGGPQFDRKGIVDRMRSGQGGYRLQTHGGRVPIQWLIGTDGWGLYIHQPLGTFDLTGDTGLFTATDEAFTLDAFVVASTDPKEIVGEFARLTGKPEMPARWTLGYMQSHRTLAGAEEVRWVAKTMREKKLPCDALIYLGTDFTPSGWNTHNGEYTWHPKNFPDPKAMLDQMHADHFKIVLHIVIEGSKLTGGVNDPCTAPPIPPGRTPDNRWPPDRQVACYWPSHKPLFDLGVDGWWPDQGDGYDATSRLARIRMYWEGSQKWRPNERPFALHRNGYVGMARYGAFLWSGDVYSRWETLKTHVPNAVNTSLSGMPLWGTDIGGFVPTAEYTGELHVRWFQFAAFCPLFRAHGRTWHLRLPWGWNTGEVGPSEVAGYTGGAADPDPSELHNAQVEPICRKYLELRYQLMPYTYSVLRECAQTGVPMMRAMWLHYPDDPIACARGDQYLWGRDILVAPVVEKGATARRLYLPRGTWFDFWEQGNATPIPGGRDIDRGVDLATMPLYVRAGSIIATGPVRQYVDEAVDGPLTLTVYPGADGQSLVYDDDGKSFEYRRGAWMGIAMTWKDADRRLSLSLAPGSRMMGPSPRSIAVRVAGGVAKTVSFSGRAVDVTL